MLPIEHQLEEIARLCAPGKHSVLSLYMETDPSRGAGRNLKAHIEGLVRPIRAELPREEAQLVDETAKDVATAVLTLRPIPRAAAAFACPARGLLRVIPLPERVVPAAYWGPVHMRELTAALDEHESTLVTLVDREHAHVYRVFMGQIEEVAQLDPEPDLEAVPRASHRKAAAGPGAAAVRMDYGERNVERRMQWHVRRYLERVLAALRDPGSRPADRILLGGAKDTVHELLGLMPPRLRARTRLISGIPVSATPPEVLARIAEAQEHAEREGEEELVDDLFDRDRAHAAFGLSAVLEAVTDARVHTLVYASDVTTQGSECDACGWLVAGATPAACPRCGAAVHTVADLQDRLVHRVLETGGRVEEVRGPAAKTLSRHEGIAALLRYEPSGLRTAHG